MPALIFRKGLDLKGAVAGELAQDYRSPLIDLLKAGDHTYRSGRLTVRLATEFGFCYGVDRAVDYAYQARRRFPDRRVYLTGEIIHNPHVNGKLRASGVRFLDDPGEKPRQPRTGCGGHSAGVWRHRRLAGARWTGRDARWSTTTCGSVLNVWKNVVRYAQDGFTSVIHGKVLHEETRATASQALKVAGGRYLVVLDKVEAQVVCDYIRHGGVRSAFLSRLGDAASEGFDPTATWPASGLPTRRPCS